MNLTPCFFLRSMGSQQVRGIAMSADVEAVQQHLEIDPTDKVGEHMTADPVTANPATPTRALARMMLDADTHRVIVVDEQERPIGVVFSTDVLAAMAYAQNKQ